MKFTTFALFAYHAVCVLSLPARSAKAECGALGVMDWSNEDLPDYVDRTQLRKCREHPEAIVSPNKRENNNVLQERRCVPPGDKQKWGCSNSGYCWINCGKVSKGEWCWEAMNHGTGEWSKCKEEKDCYRNMENGARCSVGSCEDCGCGC
ncbi:hypothetical protein ACHAPT_011782 [Fusarium lateritium]